MLDVAKNYLLHLGRFALRVVRNFRKNNGILLASAVGYNTSLSMVPLFALVLILLSQFIDEDVLVDIFTKQVRFLLPGDPAGTRETLRSFLDQREVAGWIGFGAMLLFSSLAFRTLETAMRAIFSHHDRSEKRTYLVSALMPFAFTTSIGLGLIVVTALTAALSAAGSRGHLPAPATLLHVAAFFGLVTLFCAFYRLLPIGKISTRRAMIGGLVAATLWELIRLILQWYFATISLVGVVYGSLATVVVILLSMEIAAIVLLLGAQVIAELEFSAEAGLPWYEEPLAIGAKASPEPTPAPEEAETGGAATDEPTATPEGSPPA